MACCAKTLSLVFLAPAAVAAQDRSASVSVEFERRVAEAVAAVWEVPADKIRLEWGSLREAVELSDDWEFRLMGNGANSWFAVAMESSGRPRTAARVRAAVKTTVAVSARRLTSGAVLSNQDIQLVERERWGPPEPGSARVEAGWIVRQPIARGQVLLPPTVSPPMLVRSGERIDVVWSRGRVSVRTEGVALETAALGEEVRIRLRDQRRNIVGIVTALGVAEMTARSGRR